MKAPLETGLEESCVIGALATALGPAAIGVVRLSGAGVLTIGRRCLAPLPDPLPVRLMVRTRVVDDAGFPLDDVLITHFSAPNSFTGEDTLEIFCHGGIAIARAVERRVLAAGASKARPGEFTARAVQNGKMDLLDAEALAALLAADDDGGLALAQGSANAARTLRRQAELLREARACAAGLLDYPRETEGASVDFRALAASVSRELEALCAGFPIEQLHREGIEIALLGPPNAGKSSLFNALVGEQRALVDEAPGTTRDAQPATLPGSFLRTTVIDTAGIRETGGVEGRCVQRALVVARKAAMRFWIEDISSPPASPPGDIGPVISIWNKADLQIHPRRRGVPMQLTSAQTGEGIAELRKLILSLSQGCLSPLSGRQQRIAHRVLEVLQGMEEAEDSIVMDSIEQGIAILKELSPSAADPADEVYSRFCVGK